MTHAPLETVDGAACRQSRYAIVVATRDRGAKIVPLIQSIQASEVQDFELVIVDQSSTDATAGAIAPFLADSRIRYVHSCVPGTSRARNAGIALTTAPIIAITDDDCIVPRNWLTEIGRPFDTHPKVGVVFCSVEPVPVDAPGHTPHIIFQANRVVASVADIWAHTDAGLALGAGMAIRRTMMADVYGFDELLGPGARFGAAEDNDLSWRGLLRGWFTYHCAEVSVMHDGFRTLEEVRDLTVRDFYGIGGTSAKYLRAGKWSILSFFLSWLFRFLVVHPLLDLAAGRKPHGLRRPYMLMRGLLDGLRLPVDRRSVMYRRPATVSPA